MILHEIFSVLSRCSRHISCYIAESRFPLGQCSKLRLSSPGLKGYGSTWPSSPAESTSCCSSGTRVSLWTGPRCCTSFLVDLNSIRWRQVQRSRRWRHPEPNTLVSSRQRLQFSQLFYNLRYKSRHIFTVLFRTFKAWENLDNIKKMAFLII